MTMRLGVVAEFTDRASKRMEKLLRFNRRMEKFNKTNAKLQKASLGDQSKASRATSNNARATQKLARTYDLVKRGANSAFTAVQNGAAKATRAVSTLNRKTLSLAKHGIDNLGNGFGKVKKGALVATGVMATLWGSAALAANGLTDTASQFERYETILISSTGSAEKAKEAMGWVTQFAVTTPYELDQVTEAFVQLKNYGLDPTNGTLRTLGDTSAAMGKPLMQAVEAMADAVTGENERLKEFGITAKKSGDMITYAYTDAAGKAMTATAKASDRAAIQMTLMNIFNEKYAGSMERLSKTWTGMMSNLADLWMKFQLMIMEAGLFDWMKEKLRGILDTISQMEADGSLKAWATNIATAIQNTLESAWQFANRAIEIISELSNYLSMASDYVGGWENLAMILGGMVFGPTLVATAAGIVQIATGLATLGAALMANPIMLAILAIAAGVYLIYANWDKIRPYFEALWQGITSAAQAAWDWLKQIFEWTPHAMIIRNWSRISDAITDQLEAAKASIAHHWENIKALMNIDWGALIGNIKIPSLEEPVKKIKWFFSLEWLPEWKWPEIPLPELPDIGGMINDLKAKTGEAWTGLTSIFSGEQAIDIAARDPASIERATNATNRLASAMGHLTNVDVSPAMQKLDRVRQAAQGVEDIAQGTLNRMNDLLARTDFSHHGRRLMETIAAGMRQRAHLLVQEIQKVTQKLRDHLPSSPAKTGPLSDIHRLKFAETIAQSIKPAPMVKAMRKAAAATLAAASITSPSLANNPALVSPPKAVMERSLGGQVSGSSSKNVEINFSPVIHVGSANAHDIESLQDALRDLMPELRAMMKKADEEDERLEF